MSKHVRTAQGHHAITVADESGNPVTVSGIPQEVSDYVAEQLEAASERYNVGVIVGDDTLKPATGIAAGALTPDLSAGVTSASGTGAPVETLRKEPSDVESMDYAGLQARAKELGIPANLAAADLALAITDKEK